MLSVQELGRWPVFLSQGFWVMLREVCGRSAVLSVASVPLCAGGGGVVAPARADFSLVFSSGGCGFSYHFASGAFPFRLGLGRWLHGVDSTVLFPV